MRVHKIEILRNNQPSPEDMELIDMVNDMDYIDYDFNVAHKIQHPEYREKAITRIRHLYRQEEINARLDE